jgi:hypothetical protein
MKLASKNRTFFWLPTIVMAYLFLKGWWSWLPGWSCPIRHLSGIPCPGCYLTRSVSLSLTGQIGDALELHVLGPPTAIGLIAWAAASIRHRRLYWSRQCQQIVIMLSGLGLLIWMIRLSLQYGIGIQAFPAV